MRKSRFSEPQIVHILRPADVGETTIGQLCRDHSISVNTFYRWRRRYGGMGVPNCGDSDASSGRTPYSSGSWPSATWRLTPSGSCSQKNRDRGRPQGGGRLPARAGDLRAACLPTAAHRKVQPAIPPVPRPGRGPPPAAAGLGPAAPPLRLSTGLGGAPARGVGHQPQAGPPPVAGAGLELAPAASSPQAAGRRPGPRAGPGRAPQSRLDL